MVVTVNTDAAWHSGNKIGGFAFWIVCDVKKIQITGSFQELCKNPDDAELKCILNAMHTVSTQIENVHKIVINTDSLNSTRILTGDKEGIRKYKLEWGALYRGFFNNYVYKIKNPEIVFKHVKAHTDINSPRHYVNNWCDVNAKVQMWKKINNNI